MKHDATSTGDSPTCPAWDEWRRFSHGLVPDAEFDRLADHLDACSRCLDVVKALSEESDTAVSIAQSAVADYSQEPEFREAAERLASEHRREMSQWLPTMEATRRPFPCLPPDVPNPLDNYSLLEPLGRGSMGCVYKAEHRRLKKCVAVKVLAPKHGHAKDLVGRFEREMQAVGALNHPNIVAATDAGEDQGHYFLVMEYIDGLDLQTILHRLGPLSVPDACEAVRQTCLGLESAHRKGLVHRDIKPSNLLLSAEGVVKVLDLGLVSLTAAGSIGERRTSPVGTASYMAPEQWLGGAVDIGADIYSAGCTLFKLLTGRAPFDHRGFSVSECRQGHCEQPPPKLSELLPGIPSSLASTIERALAKDREERFATPADFAAALEPFTSDANLSSLVLRARAVALDDTQPGISDRTLPDTVAVDPPERRWLGHRYWLAGVLVTLLGIAGISAPALMKNQQSDLAAWTPVDLRLATTYWTADGFRPETRLVRAPRLAALRVNASELSLIALGAATDGTFALRTTFDPSFENPTGFFFGAAQTSRLLTFCAVVVRELPQESAGTLFHVALQHHRAEADPPGPWRYAHPELESGMCVLPKGSTDVTLEIKLTRDFLDVLLNGNQAIHVRWEDLTGHQVPAQVGHYGLLSHFGETTFFSNYRTDLKEE